MQVRIRAVAVQAGPRPAATDSPPVSLSPPALEGETLRSEEATQALPKIPLTPFDATARTPWAGPVAVEEYRERVDWTGRALRSDKRGHIAGKHPRILDRLNIDRESCLSHAERILDALGTAIGAPEAMTSLCARRQTKYLRGIRAARGLFAPQLAA